MLQTVTARPQWAHEHARQPPGPRPPNGPSRDEDGVAVGQTRPVAVGELALPTASADSEHCPVPGTRTSAAGGGTMGQAFPGQISRTAAVVAPGLMVMAIIMFMGKVSGAHLNPAVSIAFSPRGDFPWRRVPGYVVMQLAGAAVAALILRHVLDVSAAYGSSYPAADHSNGAALGMELLLTLGLVSVILGTASGARNIGIIGAIGVGAYIALAGLWGSPISGTSMNPARTFGPDLIAGNWTAYWVYVVGPLIGAVIAVVFAWVLRGPGGGRSGSLAAQGTLGPDVVNSDKT